MGLYGFSLRAWGFLCLEPRLAEIFILLCRGIWISYLDFQPMKLRNITHLLRRRLAVGLRSFTSPILICQDCWFTSLLLLPRQLPRGLTLFSGSSLPTRLDSQPLAAPILANDMRGKKGGMNPSFPPGFSPFTVCIQGPFPQPALVS